jgi:hypothetical protein
VGPRNGPDRCGKSLPLPGFDPRTVQPVVRALYLLSYPALRLLIVALGVCNKGVLSFGHRNGSGPGLTLRSELCVDIFRIIFRIWNLHLARN